MAYLIDPGTNQPVLTPESVARRRKLAESLLASSREIAPIQSWTQGAAKLSDALIGGLQYRKADQQERQGQEQASAGIQKLIAAMNGSPGNVPAAAPLAPNDIGSPDDREPRPAAPAATAQGGGDIGDILTIAQNPWLSDTQGGVVNALLSQKVKANAPPTYGFSTLPDGTIVRENPQAGSVEPVYQGTAKPNIQTVNNHLVSIGPDGSAKDITPPGIGNGFRPATADELQSYGVPEGTPLVINTGTGEPKILGGSGLGSDGVNADDIKAVGDAIVSGQQPPVMTGMYRNSLPLKAYLARNGFDLTKANQDYTATTKLLATMNGAQQTRLRQAVGQVKESLPLVQDLATQWSAGGFPALNKVQLEAAKQGALGQAAQSLAVRLEAEIADITSELGTVYKGGNSSTDESLKLAATQLNANWSEKTLLDAIELAKKNIGYRENSLRLGTAGIPDSQYNQIQNTPDINGVPAGAAPPATPQNNDPLGIR